MATKWISPTWRMPEESNQSKFENYSLNFNGTDDEINCGNSDAVNITGPISISVWFNADNITGARGIVCKNDAAAQQTYAQYFFDLLSGEIRWRAGRNTVSYGINTGQWYHAVGVYDGSDITLYIDGTSVATDSALSTSYASSQPLYIGRRLNQDYFEGEIGQVAIYDSALSASQVSDLWNSGTPVNPMALTPLPTAYYPLGEGSTGSAKDQSPNPNTLTVPNESVPSATVFDFDGTNDDQINLSSVISSASEFTLSYWMNPSTFGGLDSYIMGQGATNANFIYNSQVGRLAVKIDGTTLNFNEYAAPPSGHSGVNNMAASTWQHMIIIRDSSNDIRVWRNGVAFGDESGYNNSNTFTLDQIGCFVNIYGWEGMLSNVAWWTSDQSANISNIYNNGVPQSTYTTTPEAWYKLNVDTSIWNTVLNQWEIIDYAN